MQYNLLLIVLLLLKQTMTSGTRDTAKYMRRGEEGVRASDLGLSENQARPNKPDVSPKCSKMVPLVFTVPKFI